MQGMRVYEICVVNDSPEFLEVMKLVLLDEGYHVHIMNERTVTLDEIQHCHPDLIIVDILVGSMPIGWDLIQSLRQQPSLEKVPVIVCTASSREIQRQQQMLKRLKVATLLKPFNIDDLLALMQRLLSTQSNQ